jgi:hypothetical protein
MRDRSLISLILLIISIVAGSIGVYSTFNMTGPMSKVMIGGGMSLASVFFLIEAIIILKLKKKLIK